MECRGHRRQGGARWTNSKFLTVIFTYAPTAKAPQKVKEKFEDDLQCALDSVSLDDLLLVLGDLNAPVGKRESKDDVWKEVRGLHRISSSNEAGEKLLEFCATNDLTNEHLVCKETCTPAHVGHV